MGVLFESLILYVILFLPDSAGQASEEIISVAIGAELYRIFLYTIPSLALIWYLLYRKPGINWKLIKPRIADLTSAVIALPGLLIIGFSIALISPYFSSIPQGPQVASPSGTAAWLVLAFSCILTGYLEESFFRYYLYFRYKEIGQAKIILVSTLLFSVCHIYEGPWGFLNAALSGILLAFIFIRYRSIHGIALSHGLYNIFVFALGSQF